MLKFYRKKGTGILKAALVDEAENKKVVAIIGQVDELITMGVLEPAPGMNDRAYVAIETQKVKEAKLVRDIFADLELVEYDTMAEAKDSIRVLYGKGA